ncbi:hypothetical protein [Chryseobacterium sp.]|uniref:hypothetical protein n=1 Tax=Chryseobacterium sp. TaxID=1871047 RepID=UPI0028A1F8B7|nr:hypothetical protein [Chryseobacterium sp.]
MILISFAVVSLILNIRDNSRVIIYAVYDGDFNGAWFEFREDGTYKYVDHAGIGADITRGNYQIKDSIITLDKNKIGNMIVSNTLIIREENYGNSKYKVLYQINKNNIIINRNFKFLIDNDLQD